MERVDLSTERKRLINPTLFICLGLSGAGVTTVISQLSELGFAESAPPQFVTRRLRPDEKFGEQYFPVTTEILSRIPNQIAFQSEYYNNQYGFFHPAIKRIERTLGTGRNLIVDSGDLPSIWREVVDPQFPIVSIFFAPQDPIICINRIVLRAQRIGQPLSIEDLVARAIDNSKNIAKIKEYDYWVDTTEFTDILPVTRSIIEAHSIHSRFKHPKAIVIQENLDRMVQLVKAFSFDPNEYCMTAI